MKVFEAPISLLVSDFLKDILKKTVLLDDANQKIYDACRIIRFFNHQEELDAFKDTLSDVKNLVEEQDAAEYGDFQTNQVLANRITAYVASKNAPPEIIVEPTCGKGNFILACLQHFTGIQHIIGIDVYRPYVWETKFRIIHFYIEHPEYIKPEVSIIQQNVFDFDFKSIARRYADKNILIIGNPPWVTNSMLGSIDSVNLPKKTNFKNHAGLEAMTGKGNFDIAEFILLSLLDAFQNAQGYLAFIIKNAVVKNILFEQNRNKYHIGSIEQLRIDAKKEFNVSVEASLFSCKLHSTPQYQCATVDFYDPLSPGQKFGWVSDKFVSNVDAYEHIKEIDGKCPFVWRQGIKHDCSAVMELERVNGRYINGLQEEAPLEETLVYGLLKSSDLKNAVISQTRKFTIVTQKKVGQDTRHIQFEHPDTYQYLHNYRTYFDARKSSIYNNKPSFSIFGVGDYSFKPYKVAISGLYKTFHFSLILPQDGKPIMLDDTCYFIGFDNIEFAAYALTLLNSEIARRFLASVSFADAKRTFTKDVLMRIDLLALSKKINSDLVLSGLNQLNEKHGFRLNLGEWDTFQKEINELPSEQFSLFANM